MRVCWTCSGIEVEVSATDRVDLETPVANRNSPRKHVWRAQIVLLTADGCGTAEIMRRTGTSKTAGLALAGALHDGWCCRLAVRQDLLFAHSRALSRGRGRRRCRKLGRRTGRPPPWRRSVASALARFSAPGASTACSCIGRAGSRCPTIRGSPRNCEQSWAPRRSTSARRRPLDQ